MAKEQNFQAIEREYTRSQRRPWFALLIGAQVGLMLVFLALNGRVGF